MKNEIIAEIEKKSATGQLVDLLTLKDKKDESAAGRLAEFLMLKDEKRRTMFGV